MVNADPLYPLCGLCAETIGHITWSCPLYTDVWTKCNSKIQKISNNENDLLCLFEKLMERVDEEELELVATLTRMICFRRNFVIFGGDLIHPSQLVKIAKNLLKEFHQVT